MDDDVQTDQDIMDNAVNTCQSDIMVALRELTSFKNVYNPEVTNSTKRVFQNSAIFYMVNNKEIMFRIKFPHLYDRAGKYREPSNLQFERNMKNDDFHYLKSVFGI